MVSLPAFITYQYFTQLQLPAQDIVYINMLNIINFPDQDIIYVYINFLQHNIAIFWFLFVFMAMRDSFRCGESAGCSAGSCHCCRCQINRRTKQQNLPVYLAVTGSLPCCSSSLIYSGRITCLIFARSCLIASSLALLRR